MAGISVIVVSLLLMFILVASFIGFILFLVSMILFLKKKKVQSDGKIKSRKKIAIIILIISLIFQIPLTITVSAVVVASVVQKQEEKEKIEAIENKVYAQKNEWKKGFDYNGRHLVPVNLFINSDNYHSHGDSKNLEPVGALVFKKSYNYYNLYEIDNDSGYKIYYVWVESFAGGEYYSRTFVDEKDYDAVLDYYETADFSVSALWNFAPENSGLRNTWKELDLNIHDKRDELIKMSHEVLDDVSDKKQTNPFLNYNGISFKIKSNDKVFAIDLWIYMNGNELIVYLNDYKVEDETVEEYKEMLFDLLDDAKSELLRMQYN